MPKLSTNRIRYEELMNTPLMFLHKVDCSYFDENNNYVESFFWEPIDDEFKGSIPERELTGNILDCALVASEQVVENKTDDEKNPWDYITFAVHEINASTLNDWRLVIDSFIIRSQNQNDKYPYIYLLWMLNYCHWDSEIVCKALSQYDVHTRPYIINKAFSRICRCLSKNKQKQMQDALAHYNVSYEVYTPSPLKALSKISTPHSNGYADKSLYQLVDLILDGNSNEHQMLMSEERDSQNPFLRLRQWLDDDKTSIDYAFLNPVYSVSSHEIRLNIVKRYFHDIRQGNTSLDIQLLEQFKNSKYSDFIRYRYCLYTPDKRINLSIPLLCDCILTLCQTKGESFQSFDGILDFVIANCDVTRPQIKLGMEEFLPKCNGGAVFNNLFDGFIDYSVVLELDENKFTHENLLASIRGLLDKRPHHKYYTCCYDKERNPLSEEQMRHCIVENKTSDGFRQEPRFSCCVPCQYEKRWVVNDIDFSWLNLFLKEPLPETKKSVRKYIIDLEQTSTEVLSNYIRSRVKFYEKVEEGRFLVRSGAKKSLLFQYSKPIAMRIIPNSLPIIGWEYDVFGVKKQLCGEQNHSLFHVSDEVKNEFRKREAKEVRRHVIETLKKELNLAEFNGEFFEVPYNKEVLIKLKRLYYFISVH